jgi:predicted ArsR family transcriptional regulator
MTIIMTSRQRILDYLGSYPGSTASELARALRCTAANVRHHLRALLRDGLVESHRLPGRRRGRPEGAYSLRSRTQANNLGPLAAALLDAHLGGLAPRRREAALRALGARLWDPQFLAQGDPLPRRLSALVDALAAMHYQPRWEARASGPQITLGACPYAAIIALHPELCLLDAQLLEQGVGAHVRQLAKLEPNERGLPICIFAIG